MKLATARFSNKTIHASGLVAVRTSLGFPRFRLAYPLEQKAPLITPQRSFLKAPLEEYRPAYRAMLEAHGVEKIRAQLEAIHAQYPDTPGLVLLCFEDTRKPGEWCHRHLFAQWWCEHTGEEVAELPE